jgi:hypothetical protein
VFCIVDNHPVHRATAVTKFVDSTDGALRLYQLPADSPQLEPRRVGLAERQARRRRAGCAGCSACRTSSEASSAIRNWCTSPQWPDVNFRAISLGIASGRYKDTVTAT